MEYLQCRHPLALTCTLLFIFVTFVFCDPPPDPVHCISGNEDCTVTNAYDCFPDRTTCHVSQVFYPTTEQEVVTIVASAAKTNTKIKTVTTTSHSIPKLVCPDGQDGILISTKYLNHVEVDTLAMTMTVGSGVLMRDVISEAAKAKLALPYTPYWWGLTVGGVISTGAHGSSLWGKGGAVHEQVVGLNIVIPASEKENYAKVRSLTIHDDEELNAAKVSIGVLGVITQITLQLEPMFKRNITYNVKRDDSDIGDRIVELGQKNEFADIIWYPSQHIAIYRIDNREPLDTPGDGKYDFSPFYPLPIILLKLARAAEKTAQTSGSGLGECSLALASINQLLNQNFGLKNDGETFKGYPVIGYQNNIQSSGACLDSRPWEACPWDPTFDGGFFFQSGISISLAVVKDFIQDIQQLAKAKPLSLCSLDFYLGFLMRYVKSSTAYLGKQEDSVDFDFSYYKSRDDPRAPRLYQDIIDEIEQIAIFKYGGIPHWGKNKNMAFYGAIEKFKHREKFLKVKMKYDPKGLFSNEWTDQVLTPKGDQPMIYKDGCALEGLCICKDDSHCATDSGTRKYKCKNGRVYKKAKVCTSDHWVMMNVSRIQFHSDGVLNYLNSGEDSTGRG